MPDRAPAVRTRRRHLVRRVRHGAVEPPTLSGVGGLLDVEDSTLVVSVRRRDEDALAEIYRRHAGAVFGLARRLLRDSGRAEEVVQEVFLRLWTAPEKFDPARGSLRTFLLAIGHSRAIDLLRAETSRRQREERDHRRSAEPDYDLEQEVVESGVAGEVRAAIAALPAIEREAIELAYLGGHTYREVAELLGQPEGTIKTRIRSGLRRLREELAALRSPLAS